MSQEHDEFYGWLAAFIATLSFGVFVVPMKGEAATRVDVDPLVFQSYKTFICFFSAWSLVLFGVKPTFTPWGIVSAAFWVPGSTAGIYAVRRAGLAISVAIWSVTIVVVSFVWGVIIFGEGVRSVSGAVGAAVLLCIGLCGASFYSATEQVQHCSEVDNGKSSQGLISKEGDNVSSKQDKPKFEYGALDVESHPQSDATPIAGTRVKFLGLYVKQYHLGIFMAAVNGFLAATIMVPLHYAGPNTRGLTYSISFGIGAAIITILMWIFRFLHNIYTLASYDAALKALPSFHINEMWRPGCLAGLLWSIGNISGIVAITVLGEFTGYSVTQGSMIVSGLWGIFWYNEVKGASQIFGFLFSSFVVLAGILWLSYEHVH